MELKQLHILERYIIGHFLTAFLICLLAASSLFVTFDFFEKMNTFFREGASIVQVLSFLAFKLPFIVHLMTPVAVLVATLVSIGRLAQLSEVTAMRACGVSLFWIARPILLIGLLLSALMFFAGETIVPWSTGRVEEIYNLDIKKKAETGSLNRENFWFREQNKIYNVGLYDSRLSKLGGLSIFEFGANFVLMRRLDAKSVTWKGDAIGWVMEDIVESAFLPDGTVRLHRFAKLPLVIEERPADFFDMKLKPETMSYRSLAKYVDKLRSEGVPVVSHLVDMQAKLAFPLVTFITILVAFPFALTPSRSGAMTFTFLSGVSIGFSYYIVHAISTSLGSAELIPIVPSAWAANILLGGLGGYLMIGAERA